jgi:SAM-dependent methyltransferase
MTRACPVCGAIERRCLFRQSFEQLSNVGFLRGYDVVICSHCGVGFADRIPAQPDFNAYYRDLSKYDHEHRGGSQSWADEKRLHETAATLVPFVPSPSARVLEIGCSTGRLLALLRETGFANIQGLDPSPGSARAAWDLFQVQVTTGGLFDIPISAGSVDFVILIAVLEHVEDLKTALAQIRTVLAPGGRVFAEVPDASRFAGRPDAPFQEFSTEHINFFSGASLANLFKANGFSVVSAGEAVRQQDESTTGPTAFGTYKIAAAALPLERDEITEPALRRYIEESSASDSRVRTTIQDRARGRDLLVWGTGTHTQRLLAAGAFDNIRISAFIDSNPKYQGHDLQGIPIVSPASLHGRSEPILISTRGFQREISDQIRNQLKLDNEVILLYETA